MFQRDLIQKRLRFPVADMSHCAKSRKARLCTITMQLQVPVVVSDVDSHLCLLQDAAQLNIKNMVDNLCCSLSRKVHGSVEVVSSRRTAGPVNAVSKASIDHTQVVNRDTSPPSPSHKRHMA